MGRGVVERPRPVVSDGEDLPVAQDRGAHRHFTLRGGAARGIEGEVEGRLSHGSLRRRRAGRHTMMLTFGTYPRPSPFLVQRGEAVTG